MKLNKKNLKNAKIGDWYYDKDMWKTHILSYFEDKGLILICVKNWNKYKRKWIYSITNWQWIDWAVNNMMKELPKEFTIAELDALN